MLQSSILWGLNDYCDVPIASVYKRSFRREVVSLCDIVSLLYSLIESYKCEQT